EREEVLLRSLERRRHGCPWQRGWSARAQQEQVPESLPIQRVVQGLPDDLIVEWRHQGIDPKREEAAWSSMDQAAVRWVSAVARKITGRWSAHRVERACFELGEHGLRIGPEVDNERVHARHARFPVVGVPREAQVISLRPLLKHERPGADR